MTNIIIFLLFVKLLDFYYNYPFEFSKDGNPLKGDILINVWIKT